MKHFLILGLSESRSTEALRGMFYEAMITNGVSQ